MKSLQFNEDIATRAEVVVFKTFPEKVSASVMKSLHLAGTANAYLCASQILYALSNIPRREDTVILCF